jgi:hypothetical protein
MFRIDVNSVQFPDFTFPLAQAVAIGGFLRIKASGTSMMRGMRVASIRAAGKELPITHRYEREEMENNWGWYIRTQSMAVVQVESTISVGAAVVVSVEPAETISRYATDAPDAVQMSGLTWTMELVAIDDPRSEKIWAVADPVDLFFTPGDSRRLEAYLKHDGGLLIQHFDSKGNPTHDYGGRFEVISGDGSSDVQAVTENRATDHRLSVAPTAGTRVTIRDEEAREAVSNAMPVGLDGTPVFFGEFHWHTDFSGDGQRPTGDAMRSARRELGLDFAGPADHMNPNGRYTHRTPADQAALVMPHDAPGEFCVIPTAELSRRYGHTNLITDSFDTFVEITSRFEKELAPLWEKEPNRYPFGPLIDLCPPGKALIVPHHSNMDSFVREHVVRDDGRPFWCAMHFPMPADRSVVRLFEMVQGRGAFETELVDPRWRIWDGGLGGSARTALMRGYRMGFVAGTDNHNGWPTRKGIGYAGVTAVLSDSLDTGSVFTALHDRRCYATSGARIVADASLNGHPLGSEITLEPGADRNFKITIHGTAPLTDVQVIHCGYVLHEFELPDDEPDFAIEWMDERPGRPLEDAYYYVRVRQADGHCAWLSPFWIDLTK